MSAHRASLAALLTLAAAGAATAAEDDRGAHLFNSECAVCHQADGAGAVGLAPPLRNSLQGYIGGAEGRGYLAQILISGMAGPIRSQAQYWNGVMPSFATHSDTELAATLHYVLTQLNGLSAADAEQIDIAQIAAARQRAPSAGETRKLRQQLTQGSH